MLSELTVQSRQLGNCFWTSSVDVSEINEFECFTTNDNVRLTSKLKCGTRLTDLATFAAREVFHF